MRHGNQLAGCMTASCPRKNVGQMYVRKWVPASQHELTRAHRHRSPMCTSEKVRFARQSVGPASSQDSGTYVVYAMHIDRSSVSAAAPGGRARFCCEQNPRPGFAHCTCAVARRRWRRGGTRSPGVRCRSTGLVYSSRPSPLDTGQLGTPRRRPFTCWGRWECTQGRLRPTAPGARFVAPTTPTRPVCGHAWPMATVRSQPGQPDRRRSWHDIGGDVHAAYRHVSDSEPHLLVR
jgi:hypothetical protein